MTPAIRKLSVAAVILVLLFIGTSCRPTSFYFKKLEIDTNLHLIPTGFVFGEPALGPYYFIFHAVSGLTFVDHFDKKPGAVARERLLYLETGHNQVLDRTVKSDEILKGRFGTVYAEKVCFFARPIASGYSSVSVKSYFNQLDHEAPSELSRPPESLPPLTSVRLVRIFRADPEYLVVSANYESNGELGSLHINGAKGGDWVHSNFVPGSQDGFVQQVPKGRDSDVLKKYGIPARINVQEYLRLRRLSLPLVALPQEITVMNQHYGYGKLIRQDELKNGAIISSRFLQPSVTQEEEVLDSLCESRFRQQQTMGIRTVE